MWGPFGGFRFLNFRNGAVKVHPTGNIWRGRAGHGTPAPPPWRGGQGESLAEEDGGVGQVDHHGVDPGGGVVGELPQGGAGPHRPVVSPDCSRRDFNVGMVEQTKY